MIWRAIDICNRHGYKYKTFVVSNNGVVKESGIGDINDRLVRWFVKGEEYDNI